MVFIAAAKGQAPKDNSVPVPNKASEGAFDVAVCICCGACVATCKNSIVALFTSAKISHLALLP